MSSHVKNVELFKFTIVPYKMVLNDNSFLNKESSSDGYGYAVFGKVISGMDVVKKIEKANTTIKFRMEDWPVSDVVIKKVDIKSS